MTEQGSTTSNPADMKDGLGKNIVLTDLSKQKSLSREEVEKLVKRLEKGELDKIVRTVEKIDGDEISSMAFNIFDFLGFDPFSIIAVIKIICDHYKDPEEVMMSDIRFSIAACLYMGNIQSKALSKRAAEGRAKIEYLAGKYNMMMGSTGSGMSGETVTFPRIAASFPVLAIKMADKISPKAVNLEFISGSIPGYMRLSPFASLCSPLMGVELKVFLMEACNAHGSDMSIAYEKGRMKKSKKAVTYDVIQLAGDQWSFVEVASNSPVPSEDSKKSLLTKLNIMKDYENLEKVVRNYRAIMGKKKLEDVQLPAKKVLEDQLSDYLSS
jgi:hypothetical protein